MPSQTLRSLKPILASDDVLLDTPKTAELILSTRKELKFSQKALALEMGIHQAYLCDLEAGKRRWSLKLFNDAKAALERLSKEPK